MKRYSIEWSGTITRDIGWAEVEAETVDAARDMYLREHPMRRVRAVSEISSGSSDTTTPVSAVGTRDNPST